MKRTASRTVRASLSAGLLGLASISSGTTAAADFAAANMRLVDEVALPAYRALAREAIALERSTTALCVRPSAAGVTAARAQFGAMMDAWQRAQPLAFGPIRWEYRASRIQFWPDKRGTARRQLARALANSEPALLSPAGLQGRSVALQSLSAFEALMYEQPVDRAEGAYACRLGAAIARYQSSLATGLLHDWEGRSGYAADIRSAESSNYAYNSARDATTAFYTTMVGALDAIARNKLERPLGLTAVGEFEATDPRPKRLESWRSGRSAQNIVANLATVAAVYEELAPLVVEKDEVLDARVRAKMDALRAQAAAMPEPLRGALADETGIERALALLASVREMRALLAEPVGQVIGLRVSFNSLDGD